MVDCARINELKAETVKLFKAHEETLAASMKALNELLEGPKLTGELKAKMRDSKDVDVLKFLELHLKMLNQKTELLKKITGLVEDHLVLTCPAVEFEKICAVAAASLEDVVTE
jgi:hypothetical protein